MREGFEVCGTFWSGVWSGREKDEIRKKRKKVRVRVWRKWQGKRGNKEIRKKKLRVRVWRRKKEGKKKKEKKEGNMDKKNKIK